MRRRDLLRTAGTVGAAGLAGCTTLGIGDGVDAQPWARLMPVREDVVVFTHAGPAEKVGLSTYDVPIAPNRELECTDWSADLGYREFTVTFSQGDHGEGGFIYQYPCRPDGPRPRIQLGAGVYRMLVSENIARENRDVAVYELHVDVEPLDRFTAEPDDGGDA